MQLEKSPLQVDRTPRSITLSSSHVENKTATVGPHSQSLTNGTVEKYNGLHDSRLNRQRDTSIAINSSIQSGIEPVTMVAAVNRNLAGSERSVHLHNHHVHHRASSVTATTINSPTAATTSIVATNSDCSINDTVIAATSHIEQVALPELIVETPVLTKPILKKKSIDESHSLPLPLQHSTCKPVSILKRKTSQEEGK